MVEISVLEAIACSCLEISGSYHLLAIFHYSIFDCETEPVIMCWRPTKVAYLALAESITLNRIMHQRGEDENARRLHELLEHMWVNKVSDEDVELLNTRFLDHLPPEQKATFDDAIYLCPTNELVDRINHEHLAASNKPVLIVPAMHTGAGASKESDDNAEGLQPKILLMEGAKVMFTRNLWTAQGLTNGTMGVIGTNPFDCF